MQSAQPHSTEYHCKPNMVSASQKLKVYLTNSGRYMHSITQGEGGRNWERKMLSKVSEVLYCM